MMFRNVVICATVFVACGAARSEKHVLVPLPPKALVDESFRNQPPELGPEVPYFAPALHETRLPNGVRVLSAPTGGLVVGVRVVMAGADHYPSIRPGMFDMLARVMTLGTVTRDASVIRKTFEDAVASWSFDSEVATLTFSVRAPRGDGLLKCIDVIADVVMHPLLRRSDIAFVAPPLVHAARTWMDAPGYLARMTLMRALYGDTHPFSQVADAGLESDPKPDETAMRRVYDTVVRPAATTVLVVGALDDAIIARITDAFGQWKSTTTTPPPAPPAVLPLPHTRIIVIDRPSGAQSHVAVGALGPGRESAEWPTLLMINEVLGSRPTSRIPKALFDTVAISGGRSYAYAHLLRSVLTFEGTSPTARTAELLREVDRQLGNLREHAVDGAELEAHKTLYLRAIPNWFEDTNGMLNEFALIARYGLPVDTYAHLFGAIHSVDPIDVQKLAREQLTADKVTAVVVGDWAAIEHQMVALGWGPIDVRDSLGRPRTTVKAP